MKLINAALLMLGLALACLPTSYAQGVRSGNAAAVVNAEIEDAFENEDEDSFERHLSSKMKQRCPFPGELKRMYNLGDACKEGEPLFKGGNGAESTVMCALAGTRNRTTTLTEISLKTHVLQSSVARKIISFVVARPRATKTVANATAARQSRFFQPTTSFAFLNAKMPSQDLIVASTTMFVMPTVSVRTRSVSVSPLSPIKGMTDFAVLAKLPVRIRNLSKTRTASSSVPPNVLVEELVSLTRKEQSVRAATRKTSWA